MLDHPELDPKERMLAERLVTRLERSANYWRALRVLIMVVCLFIIGVAAMWMWGFWQDVQGRYDVLEKIEQPYPRGAVPGDEWYKSELKRLILLVHDSNQGKMMMMIQGVVSVMLLFSVMMVIWGLVKHWNDGPEKRLLAKLARWQLEQWQRE